VALRKFTPLLLSVVFGTLAGCSDGWLAGTGPSIATLTIDNPPTDSLAVGAVTTLTVTALDEAGNPIDDPDVEWSTSDSDIVTVNSAGMLTAMGVGAPATIVAKGDNSSDTVVVYVKPLIIYYAEGAVLTGINESGEASGFSTEASGFSTQAFRMSEDGTIDLLSTPTDHLSEGWGINAGGVVVGDHRTPENFLARAARWVGETYEDLGSLDETSAGTTIARAVNNDGLVVGYSDIPSSVSGGTRGFTWTSTGGMQEIATLGGEISRAFGVNNDGDIVGESNATAGGPLRAFIRRSGETTLTDLGTLGGTSATASKINDTDQVAGTSLTESGEQRAFIWSQSGGMTNLGVLGSGTYSIGRGINASGAVVGDSDLRAFLWTSKYGMIDLGTPAGQQSLAHAINANGVVAGYTVSSTVRATIWITRKLPN
jgi:probable HAF family extracellular repeat protein